MFKDARLLFDLVRHGHSTHSLTEATLVSGRMATSSLTPEGICQAHLLGETYAEEIPRSARVVGYSSTLLRARQTLSIIASHIPILALQKPTTLLDEMSRGEWEGLPRTEVFTEDEIKKADLDESGYRTPGGESANDVEKRVMHFLTHAAQFWNSEKPTLVIAVSHHNVIRIAMKRLRTDIGGTPFHQLSVDHCKRARFSCVTDLHQNYDAWHFDGLF